MIGLEVNDSSFSMEPIDPAAFTGRDEDLILPGESLFDFSEAACSGGERFDIGGGCLSQQGSSPFSPAISFQADASLSSGPGAAIVEGEPRGDGADSASSETPSLLHSLNAVIKFASAREAGSLTVKASAKATVDTEAKETPPKTSEAKPNPNPKPKLSRSGRPATASDEIDAEASGTGDAATGRRYTRSMKRPRQGAGTAPADVDANDSNHPVRKGGGNTCNPPTIETKALQDSGPVAAGFSEVTGLRAEQSGSGGTTTGTDLSTPAPAPIDSGSSPHGSVMSVGGMDLISGFEDTLDSNFMTAFLEDAEGHIGMDASTAFPDDHHANLHVSMGLAEVLLQESDTQPDASTTKSDMAEDRKISEKGEDLHPYEDPTTRKAAVNEGVSMDEEIQSIASSTKTPPSHQMPPPLSPIPLPNNVPRGNLTSSAKPPSPSPGGSIAQSDGSVGTPPSQRVLTTPKCATEGAVNAAEAGENAPSMSIGVSGSSPRRPVREGTGAGVEGAPQNDQAVRKCHQDPDCMALRAREPFTDRGIAGCNAGVVEKRVSTCAWPLTAVSHQAASGGGNSGVTKDQAIGPTSPGGGEEDGEMRSSSGQPALPRLPKNCVAPEKDQRAETGAVVASAARHPLPRKVSLRFAPREKSTEEKVSGRGYLPFQKLTAPLSKPLEAVFKFMRKKWREVAVSDLNNVRIVCDVATTPDIDAELLRASTSKQAPSYRATFVWGAERSAESLADLLNSLPEPARARLCEEAFLDLTYTFEAGAVGPPPRDVSSIWEDPPAPVTSTVAPRSTPSSKDRTRKSGPTAAPSSSTLPSPPSPHGAASDVQAPAGGLPEESGSEADHVIVIEKASPPEAVLKEVATAPRRTGIEDERPVVAAAVGNERPIFARVAKKKDDKVPDKKKQQPKKAVPGLTKEGAPKVKSTSKRHGRAPRSTMPTVTLTDVICNRALVGDPFGAHLSALTPYHAYMPGGMFASMHAIAMAERLRAVERAGGTFFPPMMPLATTPFARELSRAPVSAGSVSVAPAVAAPANKFPAAADLFPRMDEVNDTTLAKGPSSNEERPLETPAMDGNAGGLPEGEEVSVDVVDGELIGEDSCMAAFGECEIDLLLEASLSQRSERTLSMAESGVHDGVTRLPRSPSSPVAGAETDEEGYIDVAAIDVEGSAVVTEPQAQTQASVTVAAGACGWAAGGERMRRAEVDVGAAVDSVSAADGSNANGACRLQASLPLAPPLRTRNLVPSVFVAEVDHEEASVEAAEYAGRADGAANSTGAEAEAAKIAGGRPRTDVDAVFSVDPVGPAVTRLEADESSPPLRARTAFTQLDPRTSDGTNMTEGEIAVLPNIEQLRTASASLAAIKTATARDDTAESTVAVKKWREIDAGALHPTTSSERAEQYSPLKDDLGKAHAPDPSPSLKTVEPREEPLPNSSRSSRHEPSQPLSSVPHPLEMRNLQEGASRILSPSVEGGHPAPAAAASTLEVPDVPLSPSLQTQMLATAKQKDACPSTLSPTEPDASSFDCFRAEPLLEAEEVASVDTGGSNLRLRNEESWSSVAAAALDISALVNGLVGAGSQNGSDRKDGSCRSNAEGPAVFGGSGGESLRQLAEERPKSTSKKTARDHASGTKAFAERVPKQQEAHRPTDVRGVQSQKAATTAAADGSVACSGGGTVTTTDDVEPLASPDLALNPLSSRPFAFATAARKIDRVVSSSCGTGGSPARASTTTGAQPASATRVRSFAPSDLASLVQTLPETPQSRGELALIQPIAGGGGTSREEVQASYAEAWSSFPSCYFWDESSAGHDAHVQADADSELKPPATRDDPVARWLALSRAETSLEGLLISSIASATSDVSASAGREHGSERQKRYKPSNASPGRDDVSISASCHRTSLSYSEDLRRALAADRASEEANPLPTLIRLGRSMTKGLTPTEAAKVAAVKTHSADASPEGAPFAAPSKVSATYPPRVVGEHDCKSISVDTNGSRREKRDRRENYECVENQVGERGRGGGEGKGGGVPPRPKKRPRRERIAPTLVCSLPSAPTTTTSAAAKMAFSH